MALLSYEGRVYAVEKKAEAAELIRVNAKKLRASNLEVIEGDAMECISSLPVPTHVFIGGSSGTLKEIIKFVTGVNPLVRIVINAITLETLGEAVEAIKELGLTDSEVVSITAARDKRAGDYHLMMGMNPVYIISCSGPKGPEGRR